LILDLDQGERFMTIDTPTLPAPAARTYCLAKVVDADSGGLKVQFLDDHRVSSARPSDTIRWRGIGIRPGYLVVVAAPASGVAPDSMTYEVVWRGPAVATVTSIDEDQVTYDTGYGPFGGITRTLRDARPATERSLVHVGQQIVVANVKDAPEAVSLVDLAVGGFPLHSDRLLSEAVAVAERAARLAAGTASLTLDDVRAILAQYALGEVVAFAELPFHAHNAPFYRVDTAGGRYFLKRYRAFTHHEDRGLDLIAYLRRRGYPAVEVQPSAAGTPHVTHGGTEVALFEYLDFAEDWTLTSARAAALGAALGRLHTLAAGFNLPDTFLGHSQFLRRLRAIPARAWLPRPAQETLAWMHEAFPAFAAAPDQPRGACHVEFGLEHVQFVGDEVFRVIDWDIVGIDYLFHDLGTTLSEAVHADGVYFPALAAIVHGYEAHRTLTGWEHDHLYEATCFGTCKYLIWELEAELLGPQDLPRVSFCKADALRVLGKAGFDAHLAEQASVLRGA
jgi:Ser/Thr protein kinase RdoA (MazF antagonist)